MNHFFLEEIQHLYGGALASAFTLVTLLIIAIPFTAMVTQREASKTFSIADSPDLIKQ